MPKITNITAREILDSRGNPTIEVTVFSSSLSGTAAVPSGASTGIYEAKELRDGGKRFSGLGVRKAIRNIDKLKPHLIGKDCINQRQIDQIMIEVDGYKDKRKLGANTILGISMACSRLAAQSKKLHLFEYLNLLAEKPSMKLPVPYMNIINGGKHADDTLAIQEFMIVPSMRNYSENLRAGVEIYHTLKKNLHEKKYSTNVGDEGGFAPKVSNSKDALTLINQAIIKSGYKGKVHIALDCAASEFYNGKYSIDGKKLSAEKLVEYYHTLIKQFPIISMEDPFDEDDFSHFAKLTSEIQIVGDDLTVTNVERIQKAINAKSCNCLLLKVNQIGTITESLDAWKLATKAGWKTMVSHRSGETEDTFIADLAVAIGCGQIKAGAPCRGERTAKYNRLLRIEELLA